MSIKKRFMVAFASVFVVISMLLTPTTAQAKGNPASLDKGDFTAQCQRQYGHNGWRAHLYGNTVDDWWCFYYNGKPWSIWGERRPLVITDYCYAHWKLRGRWYNYYDPYSWYCG